MRDLYPGAYYHVYNRGADKMPIFRELRDYAIFIKRLRYYQDRYLVKIICYCLMPNHFHLILSQQADGQISAMMQYLLNGYTHIFNDRYGRSGTLFEGRFKDILIDSEAYLLHLSRYIHLNPLIAHLVSNLPDWQWSSYLDYVGLRNGSLCDQGLMKNYISDKDEYREFVESDIERMFLVKDMERLGKLQALIEGME